MKTFGEYVIRSSLPRSRTRPAIVSRPSRSAPRAPISSVASSSDRALPCSARASARRRVWDVATATCRRLLRSLVVKVVALAGGVGAGKFLRGLVRAVPPGDVTVVVNTGDDIDLHGLRVCPDLDSVTYWLADAADPGRGGGRRDEPV